MLHKTIASIVCIVVMGFFILNKSGCSDDPVTTIPGNLALSFSGMNPSGTSVR